MGKSVVRINLLDIGGPSITNRASMESPNLDIEKMMKEENDKRKAEEILRNFLQSESKLRMKGDKAVLNNFDELQSVVELE